MKTEALINTFSELISEWSSQDRRPEHTLSNFFKKRKWLGSKDRRAFRELFYTYIRYEGLYAQVEDQDKTLPLSVIISAKLHSRGQLSLKAFSKYMDRYAPWESLKEATQGLSLPVWIEQNDESMDIEQSLFESFLLAAVPDIWKEQYKANAEELNYLFQKPTTDLRPNYLNIQPDAWLNIKEEIIDSLSLPSLNPMILPDSLKLHGQSDLSLLPYYQNGTVEIMDEGSRAIIDYLAPQAGMKILDACSGAGGKALEIQSISQNSCEVHIHDIDDWKLEEAFRRAAVAGADLRLWNGEGKFDIVLVDAPCTGSGRVRRQPELIWQITGSEVKELSEKQKAILHEYSQYVKPGGILLYATCSVFSKENEEQIDEFLATNPQWEIKISDSDKQYLTNDRQFLRLFPGKLGTDGFFAAKLYRKA